MKIYSYQPKDERLVVRPKNSDDFYKIYDLLVGGKYQQLSGEKVQLVIDSRSEHVLYAGIGKQVYFIEQYEKGVLPVKH
ncbi:hypothetical protein [Pleionea sediminis]|uniref:hypothetical protein n=1 Tax=Pleionea sediminis TaxID=2569479 RepID=UPI0011850128|nr:hypothetical protein [Pleionea sediminis]